MVVGRSALNRVYNFKRVCPGPALDRVWLQDCRRVFGNPKSETFVCIYFSRVSMYGTSRPISDSGALNVITIANKDLCKTRARCCSLS